MRENFRLAAFRDNRVVRNPRRGQINAKTKMACATLAVYVHISVVISELISTAENAWDRAIGASRRSTEATPGASRPHAA